MLAKSFSGSARPSADIAPRCATGGDGMMPSRGAVPSRSDIPEKYLWHLDAIFPSEEAWEASFKAVEEAMSELARWQGRLFESPDSPLRFLRSEEEVSERLGKVYAYAVMKSHEDTTDAHFQGLADRAGTLASSYSAVLSFVRPEILAAGEDRIAAAVTECPELALYRHFFDDLLRSRDHVLSPEQEELLARSGEVARTAENAFSLLTNADMAFPAVLDEEGRETELSEERYYLLSRSKDRRVRRDAFTGLFGTYGRFRNTLGALYSGSVKADIFYARTRKYPSSLVASLDGDNIPSSVYDGAIDAVHANLDALHDYMALRKDVLGLDELHMYDLNVPLVREPEGVIPYEDAVETVLRGLVPLGSEYGEVLRHGFRSGWIDVYETKGKRKGAYSWGSYGTHPYVLLNYNGTLRDVFTIAHEMGHSLHTWFSHRTQPQVYADYTIFLAEVASTTNESLLLEDLLTRVPDDEKAYLLNYALDQVRTTVYRQVMFAEFERTTHALAEEGKPLTSEVLNGLWHDMNIRYYGPSMTMDETLNVEWARIPHFYSAFYVYKYATGYSAAEFFARRILSGEEEPRKRYLAFLSRGSSTYSLDILKEAGVDMTTPVPVETALRTFRERLALFKKLLKK